MMKNPQKRCLRATNCHRIINFRNHSSANICLTCKSILKVNEKKSTTCTKTSPLANITNSHGHTYKSKEVLNSTDHNENVNSCIIDIPSSRKFLTKLLM